MPSYRELQEKIEREAARYGEESLIDARFSLTERYRAKQRCSGKMIDSDQQRVSYVVTRMPATYAVLEHLLGMISTPITSLLDLGAGPGTALWAAAVRFPHLAAATLVEKDAGMIALAKKLQPELSFAVEWEKGDLTAVSTWPESDLVVISYALNELAPLSLETLLDKAWKAARKAILIVEPGTPYGFRSIRAARQWLIDRQAYLTAPCPHHLACPMPQDDWCHFAVRLARSSLHRKVKEAERNFEDEKYSYILAMRTPVGLPEARIIRAPQRHSGHVNFTLCNGDGTLSQKTISRKQGELYKEARKLDWGDKFDD